MMRMIFWTGQVYNWIEAQRLRYFSPTLLTRRRMVLVRGYDKGCSAENVQFVGIVA